MSEIIINYSLVIKYAIDELILEFKDHWNIKD